MYNKKYCNTECCNSIRRVVEYILLTLATKTLELAGNAIRNNKKQHIMPRHLQFAIHNDVELNKLFGHTPRAASSPSSSPRSVLPHESLGLDIEGTVMARVVGE